MTHFLPITTSVRSSTAIESRLEQNSDIPIQGDEAAHRQSPSAMERSVRAVVARLDSQSAALSATAAAARAVTVPPVAGPVDFAAGEEAVRDYFKARLDENQRFQHALKEVLARKRTVSAHVLKFELLKMKALGLPETPEFQKLADETLGKLRAALPPGVSGLSSGGGGFFDQLLELIGLIGDGYLAIYEALVEKYSSFYEEFNREIMANLGDWITGHNDGKEVEVSGELRAALQRLIDKYSTPPAGVLYPLSDSAPATYEDAKKWAIAMGLISAEDAEDPAKLAKFVKLNGNGDGYNVMMDISPLETMRDKAPSSTTNPKWDSAKFQAWQTGFNSSEGDLKNKLQLFTTKYGNANSYHENFNKILSSQLSQLAETLKAYTNF